MAELVFNRVVSDALLTELGEGGRFHELVARAQNQWGRVLENIIEHPASIRVLDDGVRREFLARSAEMAALGRYFRSDILHQAFEKLDSES